MLLVLTNQCMLHCMLRTSGDVIGLWALRSTCLSASTMPRTHLLQAHHITFLPTTNSNPHHTLNAPLLGQELLLRLESAGSKQGCKAQSFMCSQARREDF